MRIDRSTFGIVLSLLVPLAAFVLTLEPTVYWFDSGTYISAAWEMGVAHPTGFPGYLLVGHLATLLLPFGSPALRVNLLSALSGALASYFLYASLLRLLPGEKASRVAPALAGAWSLAFGYQFWSQAINAESFVFTLACVLGAGLALLSVAEEPKNPAPRLLGGAVGLALALSAHPLVVTFLPLLGVLAWRARGAFSKNVPVAAAALALVVVGTLLCYLSIPWRSRALPWMDWGAPRTLEAAYVHIFGTESGPNPQRPYSFSIPRFFQTAFASLALYARQSWHVLPFAAGGAYVLARKRRSLLWTLLLLAGTDWIATSTYESGNREAWFLPSHVAFACLAAFGWDALLTWAASFAKKTPPLVPLAPVAIALLLAFPSAVWGGLLSRRDHRFPDDFQRHVEQSLEPGAVLLDKGDLLSALISYCGTNYYQLALGKENGIHHVGLNMLYMADWYRAHLRAKTDLVIPKSIDEGAGNPDPVVMTRTMRDFVEANLDKHPIYVVPEVELIADLRGYVLIPSGLVLKVARKPEPPVLSKWNFTFDDPRLAARVAGPFEDEDALLTHDLPIPFALETNYDLSWQGMSYYYGLAYVRLATILRGKGDEDGAKIAMRKARRFAKDHPDVYGRMAEVALRAGDHDSALFCELQGSKAAGEPPSARLKIANVYEQMGRWEIAADEYAGIVTDFEAKGAPRSFRSDSERMLYAGAARSLADLVLPRGHAQAAFAYYQRAAMVSPPEPMLLSHLGLAAVQTGNLNAGLAAFQECVKLAPKDPGLRLNLALALRDSGQEEKAKEEFRAAMKLDLSKTHELSKRAKDLLAHPEKRSPAPAPQGPPQGSPLRLQPRMDGPR